jgi:S1-C subfamily serine protease
MRRSAIAETLVVVALLALSPSIDAARDRAEDDLSSTIRSLRSGLAHVGYTTPAGEIVQLQWLGSGFLVDRSCVVVTAKHLLQDVPADRLVVRFEHPDEPDTSLTFNARVAAMDAERDLAYLSVAELPGGINACAAGSLRPLPLVAGIEPGTIAGADVLILGFPALEGEQPREVPIVRRGIVASAELSWGGKEMLLLDLTGIPGFSGAPVALRETGEVIGVVFGPGRTRREYDLEWATPMTRKDLKRVKLD